MVAETERGGYDAGHTPEFCIETLTRDHNPVLMRERRIMIRRKRLREHFRHRFQGS